MGFARFDSQPNTFGPFLLNGHGARSSTRGAADLVGNVRRGRMPTMTAVNFCRILRMAISIGGDRDDVAIGRAIFRRATKRARPPRVVRATAQAETTRKNRAKDRMFAPLYAALLSTVVLVADGVPAFDVAAHCRRVASEAAPIGDPQACLHEEQEARAQLVAQWTQFPAADRTYCRQLTTLGAEPTFTELLTCLELRREARRLRDKENGTTGGPSASDDP
jgi:hypothetical protein